MENGLDTQTASKMKPSLDQETLWKDLMKDALIIAEHELHLRPLLEDVIQGQPDYRMALITRLSRKLSRVDMPQGTVLDILDKVTAQQNQIIDQSTSDLLAIRDRDPSCNSLLDALLYYKGFHAITNYRISHALWKQGRRSLAYYFQSLGSEIFQVDIHPAAEIGAGILLDHATSLVIGETSIVENNVSILHEVTLGGTGKECGPRHPIIRSGVLIGAGAKILGRVEVGRNVKVGAGSVVLHDVPCNCTVVGVPAKIVHKADPGQPALDMDQSIDCSTEDDLNHKTHPIQVEQKFT